MIKCSKMITIEYLQSLFIEKFGDSIFLNGIPEVSVVLTKDQYNELNDDLIKISGSGVLLLIDEIQFTPVNPEDILYTKIHIPKLCEFLVQLGSDFKFELIDKDQGYGEEDLT